MPLPGTDTASRLPSGLKARSAAGASRSNVTCAPFARSHSQTISSAPAGSRSGKSPLLTASTRPSGLKAMLLGTNGTCRPLVRVTSSGISAASSQANSILGPGFCGSSSRVANRAAALSWRAATMSSTSKSSLPSGVTSGVIVSPK